MKIGKLLFKPKWQDKDAAVRRVAVGEENDPDLIAALPELVRSDPDASVRLAALKRLNDYELWRERSTGDTDAASAPHGARGVSAATVLRSARRSRPRPAASPNSKRCPKANSNRSPRSATLARTSRRRDDAHLPKPRCFSVDALERSRIRRCALEALQRIDDAAHARSRRRTRAQDRQGHQPVARERTRGLVARRTRRHERRSPNARGACASASKR